MSLLAFQSAAVGAEKNGRRRSSSRKICPNGQAPSWANNPNVNDRMLTRGALGVDVAAIGAAWSLSHFVGIGELADVALLTYRGYLALRAAETTAALFEAADGGGAASLKGVGVVSGGGVGFAAGVGAGLAATPQTCGAGH